MPMSMESRPLGSLVAKHLEKSGCSFPFQVALAIDPGRSQGPPERGAEPVAATLFSERSGILAPSCPSKLFWTSLGLGVLIYKMGKSWPQRELVRLDWGNKCRLPTQRRLWLRAHFPQLVCPPAGQVMAA